MSGVLIEQVLKNLGAAHQSGENSCMIGNTCKFMNDF